MIFWRDWWYISLKGVVLGDGGNAFFKCFNSIKVRLRLARQAEILHEQTNFNSIKVRLRRPSGSSSTSPLDYFNSIKVRLRQNVDLPYIIVSLFQFHKGSIKTRLVLPLP